MGKMWCVGGYFKKLLYWKNRHPALSPGCLPPEQTAVRHTLLYWSVVASMNCHHWAPGLCTLSLPQHFELPVITKDWSCKLLCLVTTASHKCLASFLQHLMWHALHCDSELRLFDPTRKLHSVVAWKIFTSRDYGALVRPWVCISSRVLTQKMKLLFFLSS